MQKSILRHLELYGQSSFLLFLRLYFGWMLFQAGFNKLKNIEGVTQFFTSIQVPVPEIMPYVVGSTEAVGAILVALGLFSRPVAGALAVVMLNAYFFGHYDDLMAIFSEPKVFLKSSPFPFLFTYLVVFLFGEGSWSLDNLILRRRRQ